MQQLPKNIEEIVEADKFLRRSPEWDELSDPRYSTFTAALSFGGEISVAGFSLRAKFSKQHANRDAMFQLEYAPAGPRTTCPLWRIDWRPFATHTNSGSPPDMPFEVLDGTHHHPFLDNFLRDERRMRQGNLPAARPTEIDPAAASKLVAYSGKLFKIKDIDRVRLPETLGDLFWSSDG